MKRNFKRGVSLYFTVIIMSVLLALSLGLSIILFSQTKVTREIGYSTIAFYAADSGIERIYYNFDPTNNPCPESNPCSLDGAEYYVRILNPVDNPGECSGAGINYCIKSYGVYKDIKRAIQITF